MLMSAAAQSNVISVQLQKQRMLDAIAANAALRTTDERKKAAKLHCRLTHLRCSDSARCETNSTIPNIAESSMKKTGAILPESPAAASSTRSGSSGDTHETVPTHCMPAYVNRGSRS